MFITFLWLRGGSAAVRTPGWDLLIFGNLLPRLQPLGAFCYEGLFAGFISVLNPRRVAVRTVPDLNTHYFSVCSFPLGDEVRGGERERPFIAEEGEVSWFLWQFNADGICCEGKGFEASQAGRVVKSCTRLAPCSVL